MRPERPSSCRFLAGRISDPVFPIQTVSHGTHHFDPVLHGGKVIEHDDFSIHDLYGASAAHNKLEKLNAGLKEIADCRGVPAAQLPVAWAIAKGTLPIIGVTKTYQVEDAAGAANLALTQEEVEEMEHLAGEMPLNVIRGWEKEMK